MSGKKGQELGLSVRTGIKMVLEEVTGRNAGLNGAEEGWLRPAERWKGRWGPAP